MVHMLFSPQSVQPAAFILLFIITTFLPDVAHVMGFGFVFEYFDLPLPTVSICSLLHLYVIR